MPWDWRKEFAKQHGFTPGAPAEPKPAKLPPRAEPDIDPVTGESDEGAPADHFRDLTKMVPARPEPQPDDAIEDDEPVEMVEIAPHRTVNARFLRRGGAL